MTFEYFSPKAPWNRHARPITGADREGLIRKHLNALLPEKGAGVFKNPYRHTEDSILREIVPCGTDDLDASNLVANEKWVAENWMPLANRLKLDKNAFGAFDSINREQREEIVRTLVQARNVSLYERPSNERIEAWDRHLLKTQGA